MTLPKKAQKVSKIYYVLGVLFVVFTIQLIAFIPQVDAQSIYDQNASVENPIQGDFLTFYNPDFVTQGSCSGTYGGDWYNTILDSSFWDLQAQNPDSERDSFILAFSEYDPSTDIIVERTAIRWEDDTRSVIRNAWKEIILVEALSTSQPQIQWNTSSTNLDLNLGDSYQHHRIAFASFSTTNGDFCNSSTRDGLYAFADEQLVTEAALSQTTGSTTLVLDYHNDSIYTALPVDLNLPTGYQGFIPDIRQTLEALQYPHLDLSIEGYNISAQYLRNISYPHPNEEILTYATFLDTDSNLQLLDTQTLSRNEDYSFELPGVPANYQLFLSYDIIQDGTDDPLPQTGDTYLLFTLDGSSDLISTSNNDTCNDGVCTAVSNLQDCSSYGVTAIGQLITCNLSNFFTRLQSVASILFIPSTSFITTEIDNITDNITQNNSFLFYPVSYFADTVLQVQTVEPNCVIVLNNVFQSSGSIDVCYLENSIPELWRLGTLVAQMAIVVFLMLALYHNYKEMFHIGVR